MPTGVCIAFVVRPMFFRIPRSFPRLSLGIGIAVYAAATVFAGAVTALAVHRVGAAVLQQFVPVEKVASTGSRPSAGPAMAIAAAVKPVQSARRESAMTPLYDRWERRWGEDRRGPGWQFGSSPRSTWRHLNRLFDDDDDDDDRGRTGGTYRTVCVRLCDGYYFPISFSVTGDRLERDAEVCESRCGGQARLYLHRNPGGSVEDMEDLAGRPYRQLATAFLYRSQYVPTCKCQPHPWEAASRDRHRTYALAAAARNGSRDAVKELEELQAKARRTARPADVGAAARATRGPRRAVAGEEPLMRLGAERASRTRPPAPEILRTGRDPDWRRRGLWNGN
jgi:uncharacterized protein DUF2865